jgi:hypothetical protein
LHCTASKLLSSTGAVLARGVQSLQNCRLCPIDVRTACNAEYPDLPALPSSPVSRGLVKGPFFHNAKPSGTPMSVGRIGRDHTMSCFHIAAPCRKEAPRCSASTLRPMMRCATTQRRGAAAHVAQQSMGTMFYASQNDQVRDSATLFCTCTAVQVPATMPSPRGDDDANVEGPGCWSDQWTYVPMDVDPA